MTNNAAIGVAFIGAGIVAEMHGERTRPRVLRLTPRQPPGRASAPVSKREDLNHPMQHRKKVKRTHG